MKRRVPAELRVAWEQRIDDYPIDAGWSADSTRIAIAAAGGSVTLLDARTGTVERTLPGHPGGAMALHWHPVCDLLATSGQDGCARLWRPTDETPIATLAGGSAWMESCTWSGTGRLLATAIGRQVDLWNERGEHVRRHGGAASTVTDLRWRPDGAAVAASAYGGIALLSADEAEPVRTYAFQGSVLALAWSPNGKMLASGNQDASVHLWTAESGADLHMSGYALKVRQLAWSPDSRHLATGGGADVVIWDCSGKGPANSKPRMLRHHQEPLTQITWSTDGRTIASGCRGKRLALWRGPFPAQPRSVATLPGEPSRLAFDRSGTRLLCADASGRIGLYVPPP